MPKLLDPIPDLFSQVWIRYRIRDIVRVTIFVGCSGLGNCVSGLAASQLSRFLGTGHLFLW